MSRPQLNSKQHQWLSKFRSENPNPCYELREVREGLCGDRIVVLEGTEQLPLPAGPEFASAFPAYRLHNVEVKLRKYGDPRKTAEYSCTTVYPYCELDSKATTLKLFGQLSLPIPAAVLEVPEAINPVVVTWKSKQKAKPKPGIQLSLPVTGLEAKVFELRQAKSPNLPQVSSQELLAEKVSTWSQRDSTKVELPQVLIDLLLAQNADDEEFQSAIDLFGVVGLPGAILYVDGIPHFRECKGKPVSTAAASAAVVPSQAWSKATTVTVKAFN